MDRFERAHPEIELVVEALPGATDVAHQYFLTALEGGARDFDAFIVDIVWVAEFARAGWALDLSSAFPADIVRRDFLPGVAEAVIVDGRTFAAPWYVDAGVLYRRTDLAESPPRTYEELEEAAARATRSRSDLWGYVWQGRQYEGLVCNVYEAIWGHGGRATEGERLLLSTPEARDALRYLRSLLVRGISPSSVTSAAEEESRRLFQAGRAVFMRNWPYAWTEAQRPGSPIAGRVGVSPLPTASGTPGHGALGGYQLALNAHMHPRKHEAAFALLSYLVSESAARTLALAYGRNPTRRSMYEDPEIRAKAPFIASLLPIVLEALPRPTTPYYPALSDALQSEFSAAVSGIRSPEACLARAQALADHITEVTL
jgi:multiple sugar transport system substrate-binding protein